MSKHQIAKIFFKNIKKHDISPFLCALHMLSQILNCFGSISEKRDFLRGIYTSAAGGAASSKLAILIVCAARSTDQYE